MKIKVTSENVKDVVFIVFWLAGYIADMALRVFIARGIMTNEMKKDGTPIALENCAVLVLSGCERNVNRTMPNMTCRTDLLKAHVIANL